MKIVHFEPHAAFRYPLHSDTLWGILCWGIRTVFDEKTLTDFLAQYDTPAGGLKISSCYPYRVTDSGKVPYFPKPFGKAGNLMGNMDDKPLSEKTSAYAGIKKFKKVSLLPEEFFFRYISGQESESSIFADPEKLLKDTPSIKSREMHHNSINRLTGSTADEGGNFFTQNMNYTEGAGLYCLMDGTPDQIAKAEAAFRFLSHFGLAGDASTGQNHFRITITDYTPRIPANANAFMTMSLYVPSPDELDHYLKDDTHLYYELVHRKGKKGGRFTQYTHFWSESVFAFAEGSVFPALKKPQLGCLVDAPTEDPNPDYTPKRSGIAFAIPVFLGGEQ